MYLYITFAFLAVIMAGVLSWYDGLLEQANQGRKTDK